jgi:hypothetical protein
MRRLTRVAVSAAALALGGVLLPAAPASAAAVFVELNPSTVPAGEQLGLRASCEDNLKPATATSPAFGTVTLNPRYGFLTATVRVPARTDAGDYLVRLNCPDKTSASATLHVVARDRPTRGPATGFGGTAADDTGPWLITGGVAAMVVGAGLGVLTVRRRRHG